MTVANPPDPQPTDRPARKTKMVGESVLWFDHIDKGHNVGMRHEDGSLFSATCHDCDVVYHRPNYEDVSS